MGLGTSKNTRGRGRGRGLLLSFPERWVDYVEGPGAMVAELRPAFLVGGGVGGRGGGSWQGGGQVFGSVQ